MYKLNSSGIANRRVTFEPSAKVSDDHVNKTDLSDHMISIDDHLEKGERRSFEVVFRYTYVAVAKQECELDAMEKKAKGVCHRSGNGNALRIVVSSCLSVCRR